MTRNLVRVGHFGWPAPMLVAVGMRLTQDSVSPLVWLPVLAAAVVPWAVHLVGICPRCARRMPTLPQQAAERHARALDWAHRPGKRPVTWVVTAANLALTFAGGPYVAWSALALAVAFGGAMWALDWHARLQPWCPQCPSGGLGDDVVCPAPAGLGGGRR
jgi:hypothetical protein